MICMMNYGLQFINQWKLHERSNGIEGIGFMQGLGIIIMNCCNVWCTGFIKMGRI